VQTTTVQGSEQEDNALFDSDDEEETPPVNTSVQESQETRRDDDLYISDDDEEYEQPERDEHILVASGESEVVASRNNSRTTSNSTPGSTSARIVTDDLETEVVIGTSKKKVRVRKAKFNNMSLKDVYEEGRRKMIVMKIPDVRHRRVCRIKRELTTLQKELNDYLTNKEADSKMKLLKETLRPKVTDARSAQRVEYRLMKKNLWIVPDVATTT
jgi:hypothetical protein